jgi:hypothetical protein
MKKYYSKRPSSVLGQRRLGGASLAFHPGRSMNYLRFLVTLRSFLINEIPLIKYGGRQCSRCHSKVF